MNHERATEVVRKLRALADGEESSACEAESRDMPESARFHDGRRKLLAETADEIERLRAALKPFATIGYCAKHPALRGEFVAVPTADLVRAAEVLK